MYIKNESKIIEKGIYVLKQDLKCTKGTFLAGTKVRISDGNLRYDKPYNVYDIESAEARDTIYLDKQIAIKDWIDSMLIYDSDSTAKYQAAVDNYHNGNATMVHRYYKEDNLFMAIFWIAFAIVAFGVIAAFPSLSGVLNRVWVGALAMVLVLVLHIIFNKRQTKSFDKLKDDFEQQYRNILAASEVGIN